MPHPESRSRSQSADCAPQPRETLLDGFSEGIQIWSAEGELRYANPATRGLFGIADGDPLRNCDDLFGACLDKDGDPLPRVERLALCRPPPSADADREPLLRVRAGTDKERWVRIRVRRLEAQEYETPGESFLGTAVDVTDLVEAARLLQQQAHYDPLTRLPNRVLFADRLRLALATALRRREMLAVCMLDLDGFKPINDTLGHKAGDRLLQEIAFRLETALRGDDTAARLGGDEFALLLGGLRTPADCEEVLNRVLRDVHRPISIDGHSVAVGASIGVSLFPGDVQDADQLLRHADQAMYKAKEAGKGRFQIFDPAVAGKMRAAQILTKKIQTAIDKGEFCLYYQPKVDCRRGAVVGLEALVRWRHPVLGLRSPGEFLPLIEHDDAIVGLGEWVIRTALDQIAAWQTQGLNLPVSVNIAARQFLRGNFVLRFGELLARHPPERIRMLEVEILETAVLEDINAVSRLIHRYRQDGVKFELDDFGTGYSSLTHLKRLAADTLKIDQSFVKDMLDDPGDLAIVQGVINLASAFRLGVIGEGVENIEHILTLLELGCSVMQGYGIARPMPAECVPEWVRGFAPDPRWLAAAAFPSRTDFDLLQAKVLHRNWLRQLLAAARDPAHANAWPDLDDRNCRLAHWHADAAIQRLAGRPELADFERAHRDMHRCAFALHEACSGNDCAPEAPTAEVELAGENLQRAIESCQTALRRQKERN